VSRVAEQRRRAAARGTEVRSARAAAKRRIAAGEIHLSRWLRADVERNAVAEEVPVGQLVRSVPGIGRVIATEILTDLQINPDNPMGELDQQDRDRLADEIERT
jgi:hypothetical protein